MVIVWIIFLTSTTSPKYVEMKFTLYPLFWLSIDSADLHLHSPFNKIKLHHFGILIHILSWKHKFVMITENFWRIFWRDNWRSIISAVENFRYIHQNIKLLFTSLFSWFLMPADMWAITCRPGPRFIVNSSEFTHSEWIKVHLETSLLKEYQFD